MILINGRELDEHGLRARVKVRKEHALYSPELLELLERDLLGILREGADPAPRFLHGLRRALEEEDEERDRREQEGDRWRRLFLRSGRTAESGSGEAAAEEADARPGPRPEPQGEEAEEKPRLRSVLAYALTMRIVQGVGEGYFQQQKKFNIFATREMEIVHRILRSDRRGGLPGADRRRDLWLSPRPEWGPDVVEYVAGLCGEKAVIVGIPGPALVEAIWERGRLGLAVDMNDRAVVEVQSRFYPAVLSFRPLELLRDRHIDEADLLLVPYPECLWGSELEGLLGWAGAAMKEGGRVLVGLNDWSTSPYPYESCFVRFWPLEFLQALMEKGGFAAAERREAGVRFLFGEKR